MKTKFFVLLSSICLLTSCNGVKEFGDARVCADYFFRNYVDFYSVGGTDYVEVGVASDEIKKGEYISAITGKFFMTYRFYELEEKHPGILLVNSYSKIRKINKYEIYASKEANTVPINMLKYFPGNYENGKKADAIEIKGENYVFYGSTFQTIKKGNEFGKIEDTIYYEVADYPLWICRDQIDHKEHTVGLFYNINKITELDIDMTWAIHDLVIHE